MIKRVKVLSSQNIDTMDKKTKRKPFIKQLFYGSDLQNLTLYICGSQGSSKTTKVLFIITQLCKVAESQIFWFSEISSLDRKVQSVLEDYNVQFFNENDMKNGAITSLFEYIKQQEQDNKTPYNYIRYFVVFDDILLNNNLQT